MPLTGGMHEITHHWSMTMQVIEIEHRPVGVPLRVRLAEGRTEYEAWVGPAAGGGHNVTISVRRADGRWRALGYRTDTARAERLRVLQVLQRDVPSARGA